MKRCPLQNQFKCSLFEGKLGYDALPMTSSSNHTNATVNIASVNGTGFRTICFYNVTFDNCSHVSLRHAVDQRESEYVDAITNSTTNAECRYAAECKDYLRLYYSEGRQQTEAFCRGELASLDRAFPLSNGSLLAVYWADDIGSSYAQSSFQLTASCIA